MNFEVFGSISSGVDSLEVLFVYDFSFYRVCKIYVLWIGSTVLVALESRLLR